MNFPSFVAIILCLARFSFSSSESECLVSEWNEWSQCFGSCLLSMRTRNRDVLQPAMPVLRDGQLALSQCPSLYQIQQCVNTLCSETPSPIFPLLQQRPSEQSKLPKDEASGEKIASGTTVSDRSNERTALRRIQQPKQQRANNNIADGSASREKVARGKLPERNSEKVSSGTVVSHQRSNEKIDPKITSIMSSTAFTTPSVESTLFFRQPSDNQIFVPTPVDLNFLLSVEDNFRTDSPRLFLTTTNSDDNDFLNRELMVPLPKDDSKVISDNSRADSVKQQTTFGSNQELISSIPETARLPILQSPLIFPSSQKRPIDSEASHRLATAQFLQKPVDRITLPTTSTIQFTSPPSKEKSQELFLLFPGITLPKPGNFRLFAGLTTTVSPATWQQFLQQQQQQQQLVQQTQQQPVENFAHLIADDSIFPAPKHFPVSDLEGLLLNVKNDRRLEAVLNVPILVDDDPDSYRLIGSDGRSREFVQSQQNSLSHFKENLVSTGLPINSTQASSVVANIVDSLKKVHEITTVKIIEITAPESPDEFSTLISTARRPTPNTIRDTIRISSLSTPSSIVYNCTAYRHNKRCCWIKPRTRCPNKKPVQPVMRWFREAGKNRCVSYNYGYCGRDLELLDQPIKFEQECYELCYTPVELANLPQLNDLRFEDGFRVVR